MPDAVDRFRLLTYHRRKGEEIMQEEQVLVVATRLLNLPKNNYLGDPHAVRSVLAVCSSNYRFMPRAAAEKNPEFKQLIPYVTIVCAGGVLGLERTAAQRETRLHGKISLGVSGHINPVDQGKTLEAIIARAMARELKEELWLETSNQPVLKGLINDDANSVGSVHLGLHYLLEVETKPAVRETDKMKAFWSSPIHLEALRPRMETWSQILLPVLTNTGHL